MASELGIIIFTRHFQNQFKSIKELENIFNSMMSNLDLLDVEVQLNILKLLKSQNSRNDGNFTNNEI
jgi:hypothetical protein